MAHPSRPAPGGIRRLSELLAEQQEPFLLDIYLLEKGHPERSSSASVCWSVLNASHGLRRRSSRFQLLKHKLTELLHHVRPWSWDSNKRIFLCSPPSSSPVSVLDLRSPEEHSPLHLIATYSPVFYTLTKSRKQLDEPKKLVLDPEQYGKTQQEIASLITSIRREWYELHPHVKEIGIHVEEAIFEEIREDVISEMIDFCSCTLG